MTNSPATQAHAPTTSTAHTESLGRCHPAESVATPAADANAAPATAPTPRVAVGNTSTSAATTDAASVVCPLGRLLPAAARSTSTPRWGRLITNLSTCVVRLA